MAYELRDNSGSLFRNEKKTSENHPTATGSAMIGGVEYWVSAWTKTDKNGNKWQSLSFKPKDDKPAAKPKAASDDMDDSVPF